MENCVSNYTIGSRRCNKCQFEKKSEKMWHEARRQEKKIRGIMVDYKRRADRRREFYEKIKQDPAQFLRMYGRPVKIHLDPAVSMAAEGPQSMMPWQGDVNNMIDRFDVRANLDIIPEHYSNQTSRSENDDEDERLANYERYRTLVENEAAGLSEEQCLHQIYLDEHFGTIGKGNEEEKKKSSDKKAAIGFIYEDSTPADKGIDNEDSDEEESEDDLETADLDVTIDIDSLTPDQTKEVNLCATQYGMKDDDFSRLLRKDKEELEALREAKQLEEAKAQFSGRKSRRERRAINERRQNPQRFSRPSYAARESPKYEPYKRPGSSSRSRSRSRSRSSEVAPVTFITSFGAESDDETAVVQGPSLPATHKSAVQKRKTSPEPTKCETPWLLSYGSSQNKSRSRSGRSSSHSRSSSRSRSEHKPRSQSSKSSLSSKSRSRSRSRSVSKSGNRRSSPVRKSNNGRNSSNNNRSCRRSRSSSSSRSRSRSRSKSRASHSKSAKRSESPIKKQVIKRYRRESLSSNSELSGVESDENNKKTTQMSLGSAPRMKTPTRKDSDTKSESKSGKISSKLPQTQILPSLSSKDSHKDTPKERLKRKMQAQLSRQFKADKKAEITKITKQEQERLDREEEIRNLAFEMRRREREKRHRELEEEERERRARRRNRHTGKSSSSGESSRSSSKGSKSASHSPRKSHSPSKSKSPDKKKDEKGKTDEKKRPGKPEDRKRAPPAPLVEERKKSAERRWEEKRDNSRWDGESGRPRGSRGGRWDGGPADVRWDAGAYDGCEWDGGPQGWGDAHWQNRRPLPPFNSRSRQPLLKRPSSPLMSRPRPPNDPTLMEEPMDF